MTYLPQFGWIKVTSRWQRRGLFACLSIAVGCSSDALPEPEAVAETPGAFIAVDYDEGSLRLYRTLDYFDLEGLRILFVSRYRLEPDSYEAARELSKLHELPVGVAFDYLGIKELEELPHEVVWFRTLTKEERDRIP